MAIAVATTYVVVPIIWHIALVGSTLTPVQVHDVHSTPILRLDGVIMFPGLFSAISVASTIPYLSDVIDPSVWAVVLGAELVHLLGAVDDLWELDWTTKLTGQILAVGVAAWQGVQLLTFPIAGLTIDSSHLPLVSIVTVAAATINTVNFIDGLDGLATGIIGIDSIAFSLYTYVLTHVTNPGSCSSLAAITVTVFTGVCVGFPSRNFNLATIFMGDSEAAQLGLVSAISAITVTGQIDFGSFDGSRALSILMPILLPLVVLLLPLTNVITATMCRTRRGLSLTCPDCMHMHHRLPAAGHSYRRVVLAMHLWAAVASFPAAAMIFFPLPWALVGLAFVALFASVTTADPISGVHHGLRSALRQCQDRQGQWIVISRSVSGAGEVAHPTGGQAL